MENNEKITFGNNDDMKHAIDSLTEKITMHFTFTAQVEILACIKKNISTQMQEYKDKRVGELDDVQNAINKLEEL